jgi:hypothetical protein
MRAKLKWCLGSLEAQAKRTIHIEFRYGIAVPFYGVIRQGSVEVVCGKTPTKQTLCVSFVFVAGQETIPAPSGCVRPGAVKDQD